MSRWEKIEEMVKEIKPVFAMYREMDDYPDAEDIAKVLYNADYRKQEWISVDERLPELDGSIRTWGELQIQPSVRVLCACKQKSGKVFVKEGYCELWVSRVVWKIPGSIDAVTHWMPLPEAPKMKGGAE